jgi:hypothetical protein
MNLETQNKCLLGKWVYKLLNEDGLWQICSGKSTSKIELCLRQGKERETPSSGQV